MSNARACTIVGLATLCGCVLFGIDYSHLFFYTRLRFLYRDSISRVGRLTPENPNLVFLAIDSDSISLEQTEDIEQLYGLRENGSVEARALKLMSKRWPWPREVYGMILERIVNAGAKAVLFDMTFPTSSDGDPGFRLALDRYKDRVVVGSNFVSASSRGLMSVGASHTRPTETLIPQTSPMDDRVGFTNFWADDDEVVRCAQFRTTLQQAEDGAMQFTGEQFLSLGARGLTKAGFGTSLPTDLRNHRFRFTAPPREGFPPHSIFEIFLPEYWKRNYRSGEFFAGKIVIIGAEGNWQHDEHPTPFGSMPGPEVHLNAMNAALHGEFIQEMPPYAVALATALTGALAICLSIFLRSPWIRLPVLLACDIGAAFLALFIFNHASVFIPAVAPMFELNFTVLFGLICDFAWERLEKTHLRRTLERYVSRDVVHEMLNNPTLYTRSLGGVTKAATILFSDIRGYSSVVTRSDPNVLVNQLNEYLTAMVECVFRHGGTLDKFIGDALMAVWGNVKTQGPANDTTAAVRAALAMQEKLLALNTSWRARGLPELRIGIAIHHGDVVVGNIGSPDRMEFTAIGDTVNITWKLQELTKDIDSKLVVSKAVAAIITEHFDVRSLGMLSLRGLSQQFEVFSVAQHVDLAFERPAIFSADAPAAAYRS